MFSIGPTGQIVLAFCSISLPIFVHWEYSDQPTVYTELAPGTNCLSYSDDDHHKRDALAFIRFSDYMLLGYQVLFPLGNSVNSRTASLHRH